MPEFPKLKSGAGAQYPLRYSERYETHILRFLDGAEQRFRQHRAPGKQWEIPLAALDGEEARTFQRFFEQQAGRQGEFDFQDPVTGEVESECHFHEDTCEITQTDEEKHVLKVTVESKV